VTVYINEQSQRELELIGKAAPHAVLLTGAAGIGLSTIGHHYAGVDKAVVTTVLPEKDDKVDTEKGTITVESIRRLYEATKTVEPKGRVIIIDYVERMAIPAQNAFLKLLEEPIMGTRFILLTHKPELLLPTIISRVQRITLQPISPEQSETLLDEYLVNDSTKRAQLLFIARGYPAELVRLITDEQYFESRVAIIKDARTLLNSSVYEKLLIAKKYKDDRNNALLLLEDAMKLLRRTLAEKGAREPLRLLEYYEHIHRRLSEQGNVRLQLSAVAVAR
jgi:DNA polymerase III delta prime subunit